MTNSEARKRSEEARTPEQILMELYKKRDIADFEFAKGYAHIKPGHRAFTVWFKENK